MEQKITSSIIDISHDDTIKISFYLFLMKLVGSRIIGDIYDGVGKRNQDCQINP